MATVRKRTWTTGGEKKTAWVADYFDQDGKRRLKTFPTKKAADSWLPHAQVQVAAGMHTPESVSITVSEAAKLWIKRGDLEGLERSTVDKYRNHVEVIKKSLGPVKLARLTAPAVEAFRDDLLGKVSRPMAKKILGSLKALLTEAQHRGLVAQNAAAHVKVKMKGRDEAKLVTGVDIPSKEEIAALLAAAEGKWRPLVVTTIFTGLRSSELRGLRWEDVDLNKKVIHVRQRADQWGVIGSPKSKAGHREIPMTPMVQSVLKEWKLACPRRKVEGKEAGELHLVFPSGVGNVENHANIVSRGFAPVQVAAGCCYPDPEKKDAEGNPIMHAKYGLHAFRHFFASWIIEHGFSAKKLQSLLGHSSIQMTFDTYGHLFPSLEDDHAKFAAGELAVVQ
jgi:integrase